MMCKVDILWATIHLRLLLKFVEVVADIMSCHIMFVYNIINYSISRMKSLASPSSRNYPAVRWEYHVTHRILEPKNVRYNMCKMSYIIRRHKY
jgi:hypothetical protein